MVVSKPPARIAAVATGLLGLAATLTAGLGATDASAADPDPESQPSARSLAKSSAQKLIAASPTDLHAGAADEFDAGRVISYQGLQYVPYERSYRDLPVVGGDFVVVTDRSGEVLETSVAQDRTIRGLSVNAKIKAARAAELARGEFAEVSKATDPTLVVYAKGRPRLAWRTSILGTEGAEDHASLEQVYVDARTGRLLDSVNLVHYGEGEGHFNGPGPLAIDTSGDGSTYSMEDPNVSGLVCQDAAGEKTFTGPDDLWGDGSSTSRETGCVDTLYAVQTEARMMSEWLGAAGGFDGQGGAWPVRVGLDDVNAYYCPQNPLCGGEQVQIGHNQAGDWISTMDVVAHEFGHGIDHHSPGGISGGQTSEFVADVFGALTEHYAAQTEEFDEPDYLVGEEVDLVGDGPIRNMYDPKALGDPNCYSKKIPNTEVHAAAGPGNHWFYLLAEGNAPDDGPASPICAGGPESVTGIGIEKAGKIFYSAMLRKTSDSNYRTYRTWTLEAAKELYPDSCAEFDAVKAAWDAVSVPAQAADPTCESGSPDLDPVAEIDFTGTAALDICSASVIRFDDSAPTDPALGLTNGHCNSGGFPAPGEVIVDQPSSRSFTLLGPDGSAVGDVQATTLLYSTMTRTDVSLYELGSTYEELSTEYGFEPLTLATQSPADGTASAVVSGYWQQIYDCSVEKSIYQLKEADWTFEQSIKYQQPGCDTIGGTSGSPVVDAATNEQIGINNTGNEDGEECTMNNPCEIDEAGNVTVDQGASYGQQTAWFYTCLADDNSLDLTREGCLLPAP
jgi:Zn-dependent metalloprotease/V8-like Glu-specific endopeptidase